MALADTDMAGTGAPAGSPRASLPTMLAVGNGLSGVGILGIGLAPTLGLALAASTLGGVGNGIANVAQSALVAARVNPKERGRAFASTGALVQTGVGVGTVAGAPIVATFGAGHAMTGAGALAAVLAGITAIWTASRTTP